jgi:FeS assembly SUF system regulator
MIRLSRLADYAVVITSFMAAQPARVFSALELADGTGLPSPTVSKVLTALSRAKVAKSLRGVKGGYQLSRPAKDITAAEIISAVDGPIALTLCMEHDSACDVAALCPSRYGWRRVNDAIQQALDSVTLAEMASPFLAMPPLTRAVEAAAPPTTSRAAPVAADPLA